MDIPDAPIVELSIDGKERIFDLDDPKLPDWVKKNKLASGGYPYDKRLVRHEYDKQLADLQRELVKVQYWIQNTGERIMIVFEGRDAAGKGGTISRFRENLNPRQVRTVALSKPSDVERGQWYFQRYVEHFPTAGEMVLFDRSWYNRAGVEPVMGFCSDDEHQAFLEEVPRFERMIVNGGTRFFKFWLNIGREMQLERFHDRRHDPLKVWKLSPIDIKALQKWDEYSIARNRMFSATDTTHAPWTVLRSNDKRRARLNAIRTVLHAIDYTGKDEKKIGEVDDNIVRPADGFSE
ncbi:MAG: polyphosphate kinase 2 [Salaquimonas sp.]|jgi:polyphosphate kinase 2|nr:polyphosphate kinase 2 [Salaquimonas sp.]